MKVRILFNTLILFIISFPLMGISQNTSDFNDSKKILEKASSALSQKKITASDLNSLLDLLIDKSKEADECVSSQEKKLADIQNTITLTKSVSAEKTASIDLKYLKEQELKTNKLYGECRLYALHAKDIIGSLKAKILSKSQETILLNNDSLWSLNINDLLKNSAQLRKAPHQSFPLSYSIMFSLFIIFALLSYFSAKFRKLLRLFKFSPRYFNKIFFAISLYVILILITTMISANYIFPESYLTLFFFIALIFSFIFIKYLLVNLSNAGITRRLYLIKKQTLYLFYLIGIFLAISYALGYKNLSTFVALSTLNTLAYSIIAIFFIIFISQCYHLIVYHEGIKAKIRTFILVESFAKMHELKLIKYLLIGLVVFYCSLGIIDSWDITHLTDNEILNFYYQGGTIFNIYITPCNLINAISIYCILGLLIRLILCRLQGDNDSKEKVVDNINPIIMNIGFIIAAIIALIAAGINLTSLAIIAGALSVGIGLGLKSIINNFISGIILIIEKPIKVGDRILVDGAEGIVSRIRIRSTEIKTRDRSDILIPNEDIITNKVTNFMLRESYWRIHCPVGVAYGSNVELVKSLLLQVAKENDEVINNNISHEPNVLFRGFGDSALEFELRCVIKKVNRKNFVISDLNTAIERSFRENSIVIPFPQRDINIKKE